MSYHNILDSLNEDFLRNVPYQGDIGQDEKKAVSASSKQAKTPHQEGAQNHIHRHHHQQQQHQQEEVEDGGDAGDEMMPVFSWHDALRKHTAEMPMIPKSENMVAGHTTDGRRHGINHHKQAPSSSSLNKHSDDVSLSSLEQKKKELKRIKFENLISNKEKYNLANLCKHGWNLSKGFQSKPQTSKSNDIKIAQRDIELYASNLNRKRHIKYADRFPGLSSSASYTDASLTLSEEADAVKALAQVKLALNDANPGSRYEIRQFNELRGNGSAPQHVDTSASGTNRFSGSTSTTDFLQRQRSDSTAKDCSFSKVDRFTGGSTDDAYLSPGPIYFPTNGTISQDMDYEGDDKQKRHNKRFPCLVGGGREFFGSIYMDVYNTVSPGPKYSTVGPYKKLSHCAGIEGMKIGRGFDPMYPDGRPVSPKSYERFKKK